jgi:hypothetical protein
MGQIGNFLQRRITRRKCVSKYSHGICVNPLSSFWRSVVTLDFLTDPREHFFDRAPLKNWELKRRRGCALSECCHSCPWQVVEAVLFHRTESAKYVFDCSKGSREWRDFRPATHTSLCRKARGILDEPLFKFKKHQRNRLNCQYRAHGTNSSDKDMKRFSMITPFS